MQSMWHFNWHYKGNFLEWLLYDVQQKHPSPAKMQLVTKGYAVFTKRAVPPL